MASVFSTASSRYRYKQDDYQSDESRSIQTVREKILQQCIKRLYSASGQLQTYQDQKQKFVISSNSKEVSDLEAISGLVDHNSFKSHVQNSEVRRVLQQSGLTKYEIDVIFQETSVNTPPSSVHLPKDVAARNQLTTLHAVLKKLSERETVLSSENDEFPQTFAGAVELSRTEYEDALREDALSKHPNEVLSSVATSALVKRKPHRQPAVHPQHPLNHLAALEQELFPDRERVDEEHDSPGVTYIQLPAKRRRVQGGQFWDVGNNEKSSSETEAGSSEPKKVKLISEQSSDVDLSSCSESRFVGSLWDVKDMPSNAILDTSTNNASHLVAAEKYSGIRAVELHLQERGLGRRKPKTNNASHLVEAEKYSGIRAVELHLQGRVPGRKPKKKIFPKEFVCLPNPVNMVPLSQIKDNCIPLSQLKADFPNYEPGNPSRTLFLKNMKFKTAPEDLVNIFGHFDTGEDRVTYFMMGNRAFLNFPTVEAAQEALDACLGYMMREKPLVILFAREKSGK